MHVRTKLKEAVYNILKGNISCNVFYNRVFPFSNDDIPCAVVDVLRETIDSTTLGRKRIQSRTAQLIIDVHVSGNDSSDVIDDINEEIENLLKTDTSFETLRSNGMKSLNLTDIEFGDSAEGDKKHKVLRMSYDMNYYIREGDVSSSF